MKGLQRLALMFLFVVAGMLATGAPARAKESCHKINTKAVGHFTGPTTTESQIIGGGLLHGTTTAELTITGVIAPGIVSFDSTLVLTTEHGTLTLSFFDGIFDLGSGEFSADSVVLDGSERFDEATGALFFHGVSFPDATFIDDEISGEICLDVP